MAEMGKPDVLIHSSKMQQAEVWEILDNNRVLCVLSGLESRMQENLKSRVCSSERYPFLLGQ